MIGEQGAGAEEQAELRALRDAANETAHEAAQTLGALTDKLAGAARPGQLVRGKVTAARRRAVESTRQTMHQASGRARAITNTTSGRVALAGVPTAVIALAAALVLLRRRRRR
ncbi:MAG TPA: hypothetical protein VF070_23595 [Streptosporangiaceae bacterium]